MAKTKTESQSDWFHVAWLTEDGASISWDTGDEEILLEGCNGTFNPATIRDFATRLLEVADMVEAQAEAHLRELAMLKENTDG